jgi:hypothetical protein
MVSLARRPQTAAAVVEAALVLMALALLAALVVFQVPVAAA